MMWKIVENIIDVVVYLWRALRKHETKSSWQFALNVWLTVIEKQVNLFHFAHIETHGITPNLRRAKRVL
jgi:hypothetical protein